MLKNKIKLLQQELNESKELINQMAEENHELKQANISLNNEITNREVKYS